MWAPHLFSRDCYYSYPDLFRGAVHVYHRPYRILVMGNVDDARSLVLAIDHEMHFRQVGGFVDDVIDADARSFVGRQYIFRHAVDR